MVAAKAVELFESNDASTSGLPQAGQPLAEQLRPSDWENFFGQDKIDPDLLKQLKSGAGRIPSLLLWGPPGSGKTTLARLVGKTFPCNFVQLSAVLDGVKEVRAILESARSSQLSTVLFIDEIHRFNKAQQDALLPHIESGVFTLIGATTENPSFYLSRALLSRCKVVVLPVLSRSALGKVLDRAAESLKVQVATTARVVAINYAAGDARRLISLLESFSNSVKLSKLDELTITEERLTQFLKNDHNFYHDRDGEEHYNVISAFIKSLRGSDPDAALYWGFRILEGGEDPRFLIRRMMIFASEDISNADPRALQLAVATADAFERLGLPEGRIPIAQCITYLAGAPKSNRSYLAMHKVLAAIKDSPKVEVPLHLRNAPTELMKELGYSQGYQYPHDQEHGYAAGVQYFPDSLVGVKFYEPSERGYEKSIKERLEWLRGLNGGSNDR